jgi:hypothetical protein
MVSLSCRPFLLCKSIRSEYRAADLVLWKPDTYCTDFSRWLVLYSAKLLRYQHWCTKWAFWLIRISSVVFKPKKLEIWKQLWNLQKNHPTKYYAMKLSQIRQRIELWMRETILRFEMNLFTIFLTVLFIFVFLSKHQSS